MKQLELELDGMGTSDEPQIDDDGPEPPAELCWVGNDEERAAYEAYAESQGWIGDAELDGMSTSQLNDLLDAASLRAKAGLAALVAMLAAGIG